MAIAHNVSSSHAVAFREIVGIAFIFEKEVDFYAFNDSCSLAVFAVIVSLQW